MQNLGLTGAPLLRSANTQFFILRQSFIICNVINGGKCHTGYQESMQSVNLAMWVWLNGKPQLPQKSASKFCIYW